MKWLEMKSSDVGRIAEEIGLVVLPVGSTERHGDHLPVGQDTLAVTALCERAADVEPAVVFPTIFTGMNTELRHGPGSVSIRPELIMEYLEAICDEIGRNGFGKILIVSGHGGNRYMLPQLLMNVQDDEKPYVLYYVTGGLVDPELRRKVLETDVHAHACECETSTALYLHPDLVDMSRVPDKPVASSRDFDLEEVYSNVDWFSRFPENVSGEPGKATAEKGRAMFGDKVKRLAGIINKVKADDRSPGLLKDFYRRVRDVSTGS